MMKRYIVKFINLLIHVLKRGRVKQKRKYWGGLTKAEIKKLFIYERFLETKDIPGDIVECGVGEGSSIIFLKSLQRKKKR